MCYGYRHSWREVKAVRLWLRLSVCLHLRAQLAKYRIVLGILSRNIAIDVSDETAKA